MANSENGPQHTPEEHAEYLRRVRNKVKELADLIDAAPCTYILDRAVLMVNIMGNQLVAELIAETAMQELVRDREERTKRAFDLS